MTNQRHHEGDRPHRQANDQQLVCRQHRFVQVASWFLGQHPIFRGIHSRQQQAERGDARQNAGNRTLERLLAGIVQEAQTEERAEEMPRQQQPRGITVGANHERMSRRISSAVLV